MNGTIGTSATAGCKCAHSKPTHEMQPQPRYGSHDWCVIRVFRKCHLRRQKAMNVARRTKLRYLGSIGCAGSV